VRRHLSFSAVFNFRDLGGYPGLAGRQVAWQRFYRSDSLHRLTPTDTETFAALGIRTVLDLRRPAEVAQQGRVPDQPGLRYRNVAPEHPPWLPESYDPAVGVTRYLADRYAELAEQGATAFAAAVAVVADADAAPLVMHCVAGKDRTGVLAALILDLLGVADEDIATDYALTSIGAARFTEWLRRNDPSPARQAPPPDYYVRTPPEAMLTFLAELRDRYGSVERYLTGAGLAPDKIETLRDHLLT